MSRGREMFSRAVSGGSRLGPGRRPRCPVPAGCPRRLRGPWPARGGRPYRPWAGRGPPSDAAGSTCRSRRSRPRRSAHRRGRRSSPRARRRRRSAPSRRYGPRPRRRRAASRTWDRGRSSHPPPVTQPEYPVGDGGHRARVGDQHHRRARTRAFAQQREDAALRLPVDLAGQLVGQQNGRVVGQCDGQPGAGGFTARQLPGQCARTGAMPTSRSSSCTPGRSVPPEIPCTSRMLSRTVRCSSRLPDWNNTPM